MGYAQYTVPDTLAVEPTFVAFLYQSQTYVHGLPCHYLKFLWKNRPQFLSGLSRALSSTPYLKIAVWRGKVVLVERKVSLPHATTYLERTHPTITISKVVCLAGVERTFKSVDDSLLSLNFPSVVCWPVRLNLQSLYMIYVSLSLSTLTTMKFRLIASINHLIKLHFNHSWW